MPLRPPFHRPIHREIHRPLSSPLAGGGGGGLLDFLPPAQRTGGLALGTSRLFGSYTGPLIRLRRGSDSVEQDVGAGRSRVSSDEVTALVGKNLLAHSNNFTNTAWTKTDLTLDPGFDGLATKITQGATTTGSLRQPVAIPSGKIFVSAQAVLKYANCPWLRVRVYAGANAINTWVNVQTGAFGTLLANGSTAILSAVVVPLVNGFFRVEISGWIEATTSAVLHVFGVATDASYTALANAAYVITETQLEYGSTATEYEARGATGASPCYVPKLYDQLGTNHAIQNTGTQQPQIIPRQIGELPILVGDMVDDFLSVAGFMPTLNGKDITVIQAGRNALCGNSAASRLYVGGAASSYDLADNLAHGNSGNRRVLTLRSEGAAQSARINGVSAATATQPQIATYGGTDFLLGQAGSVFGNPPQSNLVFPSALDLTTLAAIEAKLMTEYQITP